MTLIQQISEALVSGISTFVEAIPSALKNGFQSLIWEDPSAVSKTLSGFAQFGLLLGGIGLGSSLLYIVVNMIRRRG